MIELIRLCSILIIALNIVELTDSSYNHKENWRRIKIGFVLLAGTFLLTYFNIIF